MVPKENTRHWNRAPLLLSIVRPLPLPDPAADLVMHGDNKQIFHTLQWHHLPPPALSVLHFSLCLFDSFSLHCRTDTCVNISSHTEGVEASSTNALSAA